MCAVATCTCTASYSVKSSDKSTKSVSVQEANVTETVNGMQRYLELPICEGEEKENDPAPIKVKNQLTITSLPSQQLDIAKSTITYPIIACQADS